MRILIIAPDFKPNVGGIAEYASQFAKCLSYEGDDVTILCPDSTISDVISGNIRIKKGALLRAKKRLYRYLVKPINNAYCVFRLRRILSKSVVDIIILTSDYRHTNKLIGLKRPYVIVFHGGDIGMIERQWWPRNRIWYRKLLKVVSGACGIICNSTYTKELLYSKVSDRVRIPEVVVSGCGVSKPAEIYLKQFKQARGKWQLEGKKVLLTITRLVERKGLDSVLKVVADLRKQFDELVYIIAGDGPDKDRLKKIAAELSIQEQVRFLGYVSDDQVRSLYQACDIFVMPNRIGIGGDAEGFGIVYLEANSYGKPVIGGRSGGVPDAISDGVSGFLVDPEDPIELKSTIKRLLEDERLRQDIGLAGYKRVVEKFTWPKVVSRLRPFLERCISGQ